MNAAVFVDARQINILASSRYLNRRNVLCVIRSQENMDIEDNVKRLLLPLSMIPMLLGWYKEDHLINKYTYNIKLRYESSLSKMDYCSSAYVNGKKLFCFCGQDPIMVTIVYGHVQGYCLDHIPRLDTDIDIDTVFEDSDCFCQGYSNYEQS